MFTAPTSLSTVSNLAKLCVPNNFSGEIKTNIPIYFLILKIKNLIFDMSKNFVIIFIIQTDKCHLKNFFIIYFFYKRLWIHKKKIRKQVFKGLYITEKNILTHLREIVRNDSPFICLSHPTNEKKKKKNTSGQLEMLSFRVSEDSTEVKDAI